MANIKYLLTVDSESCMATKLERVGESGELKEIDLSKVCFDVGNVGGAAIVVNIYGGGAAVTPKSAVKFTEGEELCICFPARPPGRRG